LIQLYLKGKSSSIRQVIPSKKKIIEALKRMNSSSFVNALNGWKWRMAPKAGSADTRTKVEVIKVIHDKYPISALHDILNHPGITFYYEAN